MPPSKSQQTALTPCFLEKWDKQNIVGLREIALYTVNCVLPKPEQWLCKVKTFWFEMKVHFYKTFETRLLFIVYHVTKTERRSRLPQLNFYWHFNGDVKNRELEANFNWFVSNQGKLKMKNSLKYEVLGSWLNKCQV